MRQSVATSGPFLLVAVLAVICGSAAAPLDPGGAPQPAVASVPAPTPAAQTSESAAPGLEAAAKAASELPRLRSFLVSRGGTLLLEEYYNGARASRVTNVKSVSKSIISALVGIAISRGLLTGVDQPISAFFPNLVRDPAKQRITIEDLLTMRAGLESTSSRNYGAWVRSRHWVRHVLDRPLLAEPGTEMDYSTGNTHLLSAILTRATRGTTWRFAQQTLAEPLGFTLAQWPRDPQGVYFGGNDMLLTPRQMVRFGELYLNGGRSKGRQVVPAAWVTASVVPRARSHWSGQEYGYGWWIRELGGRRAYFAWGFGGQYIFIVPDLELVVVTTSATDVSEERRAHRQTIVDVISQFVIPALDRPNSTAGEAARP